MTSSVSKTHTHPNLIYTSLAFKLVGEFGSINMSEKLCLRWNEYQDNIKSSFGNLRDDNDFADVTLACDDGQQLEAHKVILASSSPFFQ